MEGKTGDGAKGFGTTPPPQHPSYPVDPPPAHPFRMAAASFLAYREEGPPLPTDPTRRRVGASFRLTGPDAHVTLANTLRRVLQSRVRTVGFRTEPSERSDVRVEVNTTPLVNEMLAHRVGMLPLGVTDVDAFHAPRYLFLLDVEHRGVGTRHLTTADFQVWAPLAEEEEGGSRPSSADPATAGYARLTPQEEAAFFPRDPLTGDAPLLTHLREQWNPGAPPERVRIVAQAARSCGAENARWSPVSQATVSYTPDPDPKRLGALFVEWLATSKKASPDSVTPERLQELRREFDAMEAQRCFLQDGEGEPCDFTFALESVGVLSVPHIVGEALRECADLVARWVDADATAPALPEGLTATAPGAAGFPCVDLSFEGCDHTLGNLLQTYLALRHVEGGASPSLGFAGYCVPHPLRPSVLLRLGVSEGGGGGGGTGFSAPEAVTTALRAVAATAKHLHALFVRLGVEWADLHGAP